MTVPRAQLEAWSDRPCDVLIVGGGITGAGVARDAALRGLGTVLVEKADFASGTSSKSGKLIHGGLRYLKHGHLRLVFSACRERARLWRTVAPHLVRPVRFVVPFYRQSRTPRWMLAGGLLAYQLLALGRTPGGFRRLSRGQTLAQLPGLASEGLIGGLAYWDCAGADFRLVIDTLKSATAAGAQVANYTELVRLEAHGGGGFRARLRSALDGSTGSILARTVVNAAGPWADDVQQRLDSSPRFGLRLTSGVHLVLPRARWPLNDTLALEVSSDGRMIYAVPWEDSVLLGTTDTFFEQPPDAVGVTAAAVDYLLAAVDRYFPQLRLGPSDVIESFAGVRPLIGSDTGQSEDELPRDDQVLVREDGIVSITGGKLTTYRAMAERVVDLLAARFFAQRRLPKCGTLAPLVPGPARAPQGASQRLAMLWQRYGAAAMEVERLIQRFPEERLELPIVPGSRFLWAEALYALENEFARQPEDVVDRRLGWFLLAARRGERAAGLAAIGEGWSRLAALALPQEAPV